ncbi:hypothetical protein [Clostridium sp. CM027]|nr:hypothetical protein [Clostridium sp. CM027]
MRIRCKQYYARIFEIPSHLVQVVGSSQLVQGGPALRWNRQII